MNSRLLVFVTLSGICAAGACGKPLASNPGATTYVPNNNPQGNTNSTIAPDDGNAATAADARGVSLMTTASPNFCLSAANGNVTLDTCTSAAAQRWTVTAGQIQNGNLCVDTQGEALDKGTALSLTPCAAPVVRSQVWTVMSYLFDMNSTTRFGASSICVFPTSTPAQAGDRLQIGPCTTLGLTWTLAPAGAALVDALDPNQCLAADSQSGAVSIAPCGAAMGQRWSISGGQVQAVGLGTRCLNAADNNVGTIVTVQDCNTTAPTQQWYLEGDDGSLRPTSSATSCIGVDNSNVVMQNCDGSTPGWKIF